MHKRRRPFALALASLAALAGCGGDVEFPRLAGHGWAFGHFYLIS
jgi:hypothetical protein